MLVEAEIWSIARIGQDNAVLIRPVGTQLAVPIYIDQSQTQSILIGLGNVPLPRPLTHDLLISTLKNLGVKIERVEITNLTDGTYFAQLVLERDGENFIIDSRPSDSIALAVRTKCPIFIAEEVVEEAANEISEITGETVGQPAQKESQKRETEILKSEGISERDLLEAELKKAIEQENYEQAAMLRDRIKELDREKS
ncbi:MAG: bifunctional nuclease family protein [Spirochaetales bacterium]|nr:bifunctional nuclease family protein [Spirochaetales bacterium]